MNKRWYYGWNVVALTLLFQGTAISSILYGFSVLVKPLSEEFNVSRSQIILIITIMQILVAVLSPAGGKAIDRISSRWILFIGTLTTVAGFSLLAVAQAYWQLMLLYCLFLTVSMIFSGSILAQSLIARWFIARRGMAMGISALGSSIGGFLIPPMLGALIPEIGWRYSLLIVAGISSLLLPVCWLILKREPTAEDLALEKKDDHPSSTKPSGELWDAMSLLRSGHFWVFMGCVTPLSLILVGLQVNLVVFSLELGFSPAQGGTFISALFVGMIIGKLLFGTLTDRWDLRWIFWLTIAIYFVALSILRSFTDYYLLLIASALFGFAAGSILPLLGAVVGHVYGVASFGTVMGVGALFFMLGSSAGPLIVSWLQELTGNYNDAFLALIALLVPTALIVYFLPTKPVTNKFRVNCEATSPSTN